MFTSQLTKCTDIKTFKQIHRIQQISSQQKKIKMQNQSSKDHFFIKLFDSLIHTKSSNFEEQVLNAQQNKIQDESFFSQFRNKLELCKTNVRTLCKLSGKIQEHIARKLVNTLLYLNKDIWTLLEDGVLNFYMDLVQMKEKISSIKQSDELKKFLQGCIESVQPLLYEFFAFKEYKKLHGGELERQRKIGRTFSLVKKTSIQSSSTSEHKKTQKPHSSTQLYTIDESQITFIGQSMRKLKINELLSNYLNDYEMEINELEQVCKICSKNIKINHLQKHVEYCQKKYILKQNITSAQNKIINLAQMLLRKEKNQLERLLEKDQKSNLDNVNYTNFQNEKFTDILYQIINAHKIGSLKSQTSKKIQSQSLITENADKYEEILHKIEHFLEQIDQKEEKYQQIHHFILLQKQIIGFINSLQILDLEHQNLREIGSSSTIHLPSLSSNTKISEKKSRFACKKNIEKQKNEVNLKDQEFIKFENFDCQFDMRNEDDQQKNVDQKLKTKQSLNDEKNVQFNIDQNDENNKEKEPRKQSRIRKSRKVKSMIMFQSDSEQEKQQKSYEIQSEHISIPPQAISLDDFEILKFLGKGAFGKVYAARKRNTNDLYALKMIDIGENWGYEEFQQITNEHEIFKKVAGQHLVQAPYCFSEGSVHVFMMEFMPGGDLGKALQEQVYLQQDKARLVLAEIVLAIEHLHNAQIIHRDLKPENLVIDERGHLKLTDFGLSQIKIQNKITTIKNQTQNKEKKRLRRAGIVNKKQKVKLIGTPDYIAPQIINGISINNKSIDWWSLGVMAYEILIGARPFCGNTIQEVIENILKLEIQWPEIGEQEGMISQNAHDFIKKLLDKDFANRLGSNSVQQIKKHSFFEDLDWQSVKHQPASIMPNYAKIRQLLEMQEDQELRKEISAKTSKKINNFKAPQLDNFIRFDILGQKTVKDAHKMKSKKTGTLKRLQSIKDIIEDKQNEPITDCLE